MRRPSFLEANNCTVVMAWYHLSDTVDVINHMSIRQPVHVHDNAVRQKLEISFLQWSILMHLHGSKNIRLTRKVCNSY